MTTVPLKVSVAGRPPCGGVDRNTMNWIFRSKTIVAPRAGAWIETLMARVPATPPTSPPVRGRGSKLKAGEPVTAVGCRPPCGGVDRNFHGLDFGFSNDVAPRAGAWIETRSPDRRSPPTKRRPPCGGVDRNGQCARRRGKLPGRPPCGGVDRNGHRTHGVRFGEVAPRAGAWIETCPEPSANRSHRSPPVRGRGSKRQQVVRRRNAGRRPPCGGVDRNLVAGVEVRQRLVAPRAGAWIETRWIIPRCGQSGRRPPCGGVDRNVRVKPWRHARRRRPPCGGVDRNLGGDGVPLLSTRRPPCGGVDRNRAAPIFNRQPRVAPRAGAWIETTRASWSLTLDQVAPRAGAWIETSTMSGRVSSKLSPPVRGRGSKHEKRLPHPVEIMSPPVRGRGSKLDGQPDADASAGRPPCGAWIETSPTCS